MVLLCLCVRSCRGVVKCLEQVTDAFMCNNLVANKYKNVHRTAFVKKIDKG